MIRVTRIRRKLQLPPGVFALYPANCPKPVLLDKRFREAIQKVSWRYSPKTNRIRGFFGKDKTRQYLHRYVLTLAKRPYPEVTFENGEWWDCRLLNLKPYDREEDGARRKPFKGKRRKGVIWHKRKKKFIAMIRCHGKLRHLGYFSTADSAARAYAEAWNQAHPNAEPLPLH